MTESRQHLFIALAESHHPAWARKLDLSQADFGKGKRMIVKGWCIDVKYKISVPDMAPTPEAMR